MTVTHQQASVKICGITEAAGYDACVEYGARWIGFVFFEKSPRCLAPVQAQALMKRSDHDQEHVGLFVNPTNDAIARVLDHVALDVLQIYAPVERATEIKSLFRLPVWSACAVSASSDLPQSKVADGLVIESKAPSESSRPGGNGVSFDWTVLQNWRSPCPWLLAGGLTPLNVAEARRLSNASAFDVSSGVEIQPGVKSPLLIRDFIQALI